MKKLIAIGIAFAVLLFAGATAQAASVAQDITVLVDVEDVFYIDVFKDPGEIGDTTLGPYSIALDSETRSVGDNVQISCGTNHNVPWTIQVKSTDLIGDGGQIITVDNMEYTPWPGGYADPPATGTPRLGGPFTLSNSDQLVYTPNPETEYTDTWLTTMCGLTIHVPWEAAADNYTAYVTFTMTE